MEKLTHRECHQCGWIGPRDDEVTIDLGYGRNVDVCPECKAPEPNWITAAEAAEILASYD